MPTRSRPFHALRRAVATRLLPLAAAASLALPGCSSAAYHGPDDGAARPAPTRAAARELSYTSTSEIRFGGDLVGYLVDVNPVPEGIVDSRPWEPGTALIQDRGFQFIGFVSPRGTTYRFDEDEVARPVGQGSRSAGIAAFFRRNGEPQLVPLNPAG
jgi:hypothetical protein